MSFNPRALAALISLPLLAACTGEVLPGEKGMNGNSPGAGGTGGPGAGGSGTTGTASCEDDGMGVAIPKRLVRLSYAQLANGVSSTLGATARAAVDETDIVPSAGEREFQPLFNEGTQISTAVLPKTMQLIEAASTAIAAAPNCTSGDDVCAQQYLLILAEQVYRRPVTAEEQASIVQLHTELKAHGNTIDEAVRYGVQGILSGAPALYRTEFGAQGVASSRLEPHEIASQISYFLSDGPPDPPLIEAAASGALATDAGVRAQVDRLLLTEPVRANLKQAMLAYFQIGNVLVDIKDGGLYPEYTSGLRNSMFTENELFLKDMLWNGKVNDILSSRRAFVNKVIAPIYNVAYPGPASDLEDVFLPVELPAAERAGLLTRGAMLAMRSRPEDTSVVSRGLFVNATMLCASQPPEPPASVLGAVEEQLKNTTKTQREKAEDRASTSPCSGCHAFFDAYGLVLETYDAIGRFRTNYVNFENQPAINTTATLPEVAGGAEVANVFEFVDAVTQNGRFSHCVAVNLMRYALADAGLLDSEDCSVSKVNEAFRATDQTFSSLIKEVAVSQTISTRVGQ